MRAASLKQGITTEKGGSMGVRSTVEALNRSSGSPFSSLLTLQRFNALTLQR
jgi:hypothetical protein